MHITQSLSPQRFLETRSLLEIENETFESTAIVPDNLRTRVQYAHAEHSRDPATGVNEACHLSVTSSLIMS